MRFRSTILSLILLLSIVSSTIAKNSKEAKKTDGEGKGTSEAGSDTASGNTNKAKAKADLGGNGRSEILLGGKKDVNDAPDIENAVKFVVPGLIALMLIGGLIGYCCYRRQEKKEAMAERREQKRRSRGGTNHIHV